MPPSPSSYPGAPTSTQRRRGYAGLAVLVAIICLLTGSGASPVHRLETTAGTASCGTTSGGAPKCGVWWGMAPGASDATTPATVAAYEGAAERRLDVVHVYHRWYDRFPTASEQQLSDSGHLVLFGWDATDAAGRPISWAAIARGAFDPQIDALAQRLQLLPRVAIAFSHEPEADLGAHGSVGDFAAAYRHVHDRMRADRATNVSWVWDVMGLSDPVWLARYPSLWPGESYVDRVAWDPYNWASCRGQPWRTFAQIARPFYDWLIAAGHGDKPFMLAEFGSVENRLDRFGKAAWFAAIPTALATLPNLKALVYFNVASPPAKCDWPVSTSDAARGAFLQLAGSQPFRTSAADDPTIRLPAP